MPKIIFSPSQTELEFENERKILAAAIRAKVPIRFGCGACSCGTCAVEVDASDATLNDMDHYEKELLEKLDLPTEGHIRLACKTYLKEGTLKVDLDFQDTYSPEEVLDDEEDYEEEE